MDHSAASLLPLCMKGNILLMIAPISLWFSTISFFNKNTADSLSDNILKCISTYLHCFFP